MGVLETLTQMTGCTGGVSIYYAAKSAAIAANNIPGRVRIDRKFRQTTIERMQPLFPLLNLKRVEFNINASLPANWFESPDRIEAMTFGYKIYFKKSGYQDSDAGLKLIAHELVHVDQIRRRGDSEWQFACDYGEGYLRAGSYEKNPLEVEAIDFVANNPIPQLGVPYWRLSEIDQEIGTHIPVGNVSTYAWLIGQKIIYRDASGHVNELANDFLNRWQRTDLTEALNAQPAAGDPSGYILGGDQHIIYRGTNSHIYELWWSNAYSWRMADLTQITNAQPAAGDPSGYILGGDQHIIYRGTNSHIYELWWSNAYSWQVNDLTTIANAPQAKGDPSGCKLELLGKPPVQHVVYRGIDDHIHQIWWQPSTGWSHYDLTSATHAPNSAGDPMAYFIIKKTPILPFASEGFMHVMFRGNDNHIHQLWWTATTSWNYYDLTSATSSPNAKGDPFGYAAGSSSTHVVYRGIDDHPHDLYWEPQPSWKHEDLTSLTHCQNIKSNPSGYAVNIGQQRVVCVGANNHIYNFWI